MFEIRAKTQPVVIERFDINMDVGEYPVQVYYRPGIADYRYDDSYRLAFGSNITGVGKGLVTPLPNLASSVTVFPGEPMTFYVTVASEDTSAANLWYDDGVGAGTIYASDDNINLIEGYASGYPWRAFALDRRWNGKKQIALCFTSFTRFFEQTELNSLVSIFHFCRSCLLQPPNRFPNSVS